MISDEYPNPLCYPDIKQITFSLLLTYHFFFFVFRSLSHTHFVFVLSALRLSAVHQNAVTPTSSLICFKAWTQQALQTKMKCPWRIAQLQQSRFATYCRHGFAGVPHLVVVNLLGALRHLPLSLPLSLHLPPLLLPLIPHILLYLLPLYCLIPNLHNHQTSNEKVSVVLPWTEASMIVGCPACV